MTPVELARRAENPLNDPFLRPKQIAEATGKHPETVRIAIRNGDLKGQKLGPRSVGSRVSWVNAWLQKLAKPEGTASDPEAA